MSDTVNCHSVELFEMYDVHYAHENTCSPHDAEALRCESGRAGGIRMRDTPSCEMRESDSTHDDNQPDWQQRLGT